jgi:hypothetical protein
MIERCELPKDEFEARLNTARDEIILAEEYCDYIID